MRVELNLPIERKWFDMIARGEKKEEYRTMKQLRRYLDTHNPGEGKAGKGEGILLILRNGYTLKSMAVVVDVTLVELRSSEEAIHPEWGGPTKGMPLHMVLHLGKLLMVAPYGEVRKQYGNGGAK